MKSIYFKAAALLMLLCLTVSKHASAQTVVKDTTVTIKVSGITCGGDLPIICERVKKEKGVHECKAVSKASSTTSFEVTYNPSEITYEKVVAAIEDAPSCDYPNQRPYKVKKK